MKAYGDIESVNLETGERYRRVAGDGESRLQVDRVFVDVTRLGPRGPTDEENLAGNEAIDRIVLEAQRRLKMHYRNGREAKNGDKIVKLEGGKVVSFGVLHSATPGNDYCNGNIAVVQSANDYACMCDCLHVDDLAALLAEKGLDKRPDGK